MAYKIVQNFNECVSTILEGLDYKIIFKTSALKRAVPSGLVRAKRARSRGPLGSGNFIFVQLHPLGPGPHKNLARSCGTQLIYVHIVFIIW